MSLPRAFFMGRAKLVAINLALGIEAIRADMELRSSELEEREGKGHGHRCGQGNPGSFRKAGSKAVKPNPKLRLAIRKGGPKDGTVRLGV